jgi:DNA-binding transcriptional MerR regulator
MDEYTLTSTDIGRKALVTAATVTKYARAGLLEYRTASDGTRLYRASDADRVREIFTRRMSRRSQAAA